jgi:NADPH:quinone reductase-like Zn-dependent oxidoreductase
MKLRYKVLGIIAGVVAAGVLALAFAMSHAAPCSPAPALPAGTTPMKAMVHRCYGSPEVLTYEDIARPSPADNEILVKVHAASVNPLDWHYMEGTPYLVRLEAGLGRPNNPRLGVDFSGTVAAVGQKVTRFKPGDEVFGGRFGAFAEYVVVREDRAVALKPAGVSFEQAASVPIAGITALQALRDAGRVRAGQKVLIIGASGGVGTFAVQVAKSLGAQVTGVCSTRNLEMVRSLGADHVIDYTREDVTRSDERYEVIMDNVGNRSLSDLMTLRHLLAPHGTFVLVGGGGPDAGRWIGPLGTPIDAHILQPFVSQKYLWLLAQLNPEDLAKLGELMQSGKMTPVIDRRYKLSEAAEALRYLEKGHARGKVVLSVDEALADVR